MTEDKRRGTRRPVRFALAAAALAVALCVTAAAANPEAVQQLWRSFSISVLYEGSDTVVVQTDMPGISVARVGGRVMLTVDAVQTDITEALEQSGVYEQIFEIEAGSAKLTVESDLTWEMDVTMEDGKEISYSSERFEMYCPADWDEDAVLAPDADSFITYTFTDDENVDIATYLPPEE